MKKILTLFGVTAAVVVLAGCGSQPAPVTPPTTSQAAPAPSATPAPAATTAPDNSAAVDSPPVPTTTAPATTSDVDNTLNSVNADLNAADKNAPDPNTLNDVNTPTANTAPTN